MDGNRDHINRASNNLNMGAAINIEKFERDGCFCSLVRSFKASANGCGTPIILTLFGPLRSWIYPKIFRSSKV